MNDVRSGNRGNDINPCRVWPLVASHFSLPTSMRVSMPVSVSARMGSRARARAWGPSSRILSALHVRDFYKCGKILSCLEFRVPCLCWCTGTRFEGYGSGRGHARRSIQSFRALPIASLYAHGAGSVMLLRHIKARGISLRRCPRFRALRFGRIDLMRLIPRITSEFSFEL